MPAQSLDAMVMTGGAVLDEGEPADSPRAIAQAGPRAAMLLHRAADAALTGLPMMAPMPPGIAESVTGYVDLARKFTPQGAHYLENHRGHLMFVKPEERRFVTAELIRLTTFTATGKDLKERIAAPRHRCQWRMLPKDHDGVVGHEDLVEDNGTKAAGKEVEDAAERVTWKSRYRWFADSPVEGDGLEISFARSR